MKKVSNIFIAALIALLLGIAVIYRVSSYRIKFDAVVRETLETTDGYDQAFIDMVTRLEEELATRASFGYIGEKDPMTGQKREIVKTVAVKKFRRRRKLDEPKPDIDPFRLSAIIYNDQQNKFTAIMMFGERSMAVEIGDIVEGRTVLSISRNNVKMITENNEYLYDIEGQKYKKPLTEFKKLGEE